LSFYLKLVKKMSPLRILICTTGKDVEIKGDWPPDRTVFSAMRVHTFDKLVTLVDRNEASCVTIAKLKEFYTNRPDRLEIITLDVSDFFSCYHAIQDVLERYKAHNVTINISGGKKMLAVSSVMCAFNNGIPICHYEATKLTRLPVIRGFSVIERFSKEQQAIIGALNGEMTLNALVKKMAKVKITEEKVKDELLGLRKMEMVSSKVVKKKLKVKLTNGGIYLSKILPK